MEPTIRLERRFAIIDEWLLDLDISDRAVRLYAVLARYADNDTHKAYPSRETLAERLKCSTKSVDRAAQELLDAGAMSKQHRHNSSIIYTLNVVQGGGHHSPGGSTPVSRGVDTDVHLTRTTELEPENYIEAKKNATSMPDNFEPSETIIDTFENKYGSVLTYEDTLEAFRDYHLAKGSRFKDWDAAFRTWCRNAITFKGPKTVIHKQELKPNAEIPDARAWVKQMHDIGEHFECREGEFGCK
jgi:hypothetical protein